MLKGIPPIISPELMECLMEMGHGDEIVLADGNFPAASIGRRVIRADGHGIPELLRAILKFFPLDTSAEYNVILMDNEKSEKPPIWQEYEKILRESGEDARIHAIGRFEFYERAKQAFCIVATGEKALYACIILKKGVVTDKNI